MKITSVLASVVILSLVACTGSTPDESAAPSVAPLESPPGHKFVGTWEWQPGSTSEIVCDGTSVHVTDLSNPFGDGTPAWFVLTELDSRRLRDVDVLGCVHDYDRRGLTATILAGSSCSNYPDGSGGTFTATTTANGRKSISADGDTLTGSGEETLEGKPCRMIVSGTAKRAAPR